MDDLRAMLAGVPAKRGPAPWRGYEHVRGWGVFSLPFESGHLLAFRVAPESDFGPFRTVWHRDPAGRWSIYVDAERLDIACPRYFGVACTYTGHARIDVSWTGPASLRVRVDDPALELELTASSTRLVDGLNAVSGLMPLTTWRSAAVIRGREMLGGALGLGRLRFHTTMPSGHTGTVMPERFYFVDKAQASLDGVDLGRPVHLDETPRIGDFPLPARGVLVIGQGMWKILDEVEYQRTLRASLGMVAGA